MPMVGRSERISVLVDARTAGVIMPKQINVYCMNDRIARLMRLAQKTGSPLIIHDAHRDTDMVFMSVDEYEQLLDQTEVGMDEWPGEGEESEDEDNGEELDDWHSVADVLHAGDRADVEKTQDFHSRVDNTNDIFSDQDFFDHELDKKEESDNAQDEPETVVEEQEEYEADGSSELLYEFPILDTQTLSQTSSQADFLVRRPYEVERAGIVNKQAMDESIRFAPEEPIIDEPVFFEEPV